MFPQAFIRFLILVFLAPAVGSCERRPPSHVGYAMKTELWWSYLAEYDGIAGSTVVNLALKRIAPIHEFSTLVVTGVSYQPQPGTSGLPDATELDFLDRLSRERLALILKHSKGILVGTFTHKDERLDYIYVADAVGLESTLRELYQAQCPARRSYIHGFGIGGSIFGCGDGV